MSIDSGGFEFPSARKSRGRDFVSFRFRLLTNHPDEDASNGSNRFACRIVELIVSGNIVSTFFVRFAGE